MNSQLSSGYCSGLWGGVIPIALTGSSEQGSSPTPDAQIGAETNAAARKTVAAVLESARRRRLFWVFLDHGMTAGPLERVLDTLAAAHSAEVAAVSLDEALRLCQKGPAVRRCL